MVINIMCFSKIVFLLILITFSKNIFASPWVEGNKLLIQGLDKITARIETFEAKKYLEKAMGSTVYERKPAEEANIKFIRSVYFVKDMKAGDIITKEHVRRIRPGFGLPPKFEKEIIGKLAKIDIKSGTATSWELIDE